MIGNIFIKSQSEYLEFNSDRTNFVDNYLTRNLIKTLESLNDFIQKSGSKIKNELKYGKNQVPTGGAIPINTSEESNIKTASILIDRSKTTNFYIPSEQIDLSDYISLANDSLGKNINKDEIRIIVNNKKTSKILSSIETPCDITVNFRYDDPLTGIVSKDVYLCFEKKTSNISGKTNGNSLFTIQSGTDYKVDIEIVSDIIYAIDKVYSTKSKNDYLPLIACSIRSIFEISKDRTIRKHKNLFKKFNNAKFSEKTKRELKDTLLRDAIHIFYLVKKNAKLQGYISEVLDISFKTFNNLLDLRLLREAIKNSHIGAHQSTRFLSKPRIENGADICGIFTVICDILIKMDKNKLNDLYIKKINEDDLNFYFDSLVE
ncbi:hypothetical protein J8V57_17675 [Xenorhabdus sp. PB61.4]|uniref:hypothetical protein n=1 Tax=Xenorhabdus sp. PB61.4 TaxID=2788940 RepID=UPI001E63342F|nr:hypothetical protein [Xenorhabdus sp. PB61.4]MCC8368066.1 hypothetical protein [Xenorhabdus sp. PB61.4]